MTKQQFQKKALSAAAHLQKLQADGLIIDPVDMPLALAYVDFVGGHRLKGYWHKSIDPNTGRFKVAECNFQYLAKQVQFDDRLRHILWDALTKVELAVRSCMANYLSIHYSPHWFLDNSIFDSTSAWGFGHIVKKIEDEVRRLSERTPVKHYFNNYDRPYLPPSWVMSECVTLGFWSRSYAILHKPDDKKAIAKRFGIDQPEVFESWLHSITYCRNLVAHHSQILWVGLRISPQNYKGNAKKAKGGQPTGLNLGPKNKSLSAIAKVMHHLLFNANIPNTLKQDLVALFQQVPAAFPQAIGFLAGWENQPGW